MLAFGIFRTGSPSGCWSRPSCGGPRGGSSSTTCSCWPATCCGGTQSVRSALQERFERLLLDEFQDTDPIQIELAVRIAGGAEADAEDWRDVEVPAGRLFVVGDPKQSIYRFRRANIATYLTAQDLLGETVALTTNFRTVPPILRLDQHGVRDADPAPGSRPTVVPGPVPHRTGPSSGRPRRRARRALVTVRGPALAATSAPSAGQRGPALTARRAPTTTSRLVDDLLCPADLDSAGSGDQLGDLATVLPFRRSGDGHRPPRMRRRPDSPRPPTRPASGPAVTILGAEPHDDLPRAQASVLREREAADVAAVIEQALPRRLAGVRRPAPTAGDPRRPATSPYWFPPARRCPSSRTPSTAPTSRTAPRPARSSTRPPRSATCSPAPAPSATRATSSRSSPPCARRCSAAATTTCSSGSAPAARST